MDLTYFASGNAFFQSWIYIPCSPSGVTNHLTFPLSPPSPSVDSFSMAAFVAGERGDEAYTKIPGSVDLVSLIAVDRPPMGTRPILIYIH